MNYIRLWSLPDAVTMDRSTNDSRALLNNILETVMCCAFQSLPSNEVERVLGNGNYATTGLNILPPLLQGIKLDIPARAQRISKCTNSIDSQIRTWPQERKRQRDQSRSQSGKSFERYWMPSDYRTALTQAIEETESCKSLALYVAQNTHDPSVTDISSLLKGTASKLQLPDANEAESFTQSLTRPYGTPEARVGVLLGQCPVNRLDNETNIQEGMTALPSALLDVNFSPSNSLVWTYNLRQPFQPRPNSSRTADNLDPHELEVLSQFHRTLIAGSNLKVVFLCGRDVESVIMNPELAGNRTTLTLRGCSFPAFLETDTAETKFVKRIYVRLQSSLAVTSRCDSWEETKEHAEAFRFAAIVTDTPDIYGFTIGSNLIAKEIILRYWAEREGFYEPMTINCMDPKIREWFTLKGITLDSEIEPFERLGGTLIRGAFLLLMALPQCPLNGNKKKGPALKYDAGKKPNGLQRVFAKETLKEAKALYTKFTGRGDRTDIEGSSNPKTSGNLMIEAAEKALLEPNEKLDEIFHRSRDYYRDLSEEATLEDNGFQYAPKFKNTLSDPNTQERNNLLRGKWFQGHLYRKHGSHYQIWALRNMLTVRFTHDGVNLDERFILQVLMSPPGTRHPNVYATQAKDDDPACRVAVKVSGILDTGEPFSLFPTQSERSWKEPMRTNTVFDWFAGQSLRQIAMNNAPRRYIYIAEKDQTMQTPELVKFVKGGFTDGSLTEQESEIWDAERSKVRKRREQ